MSEFPRGLPSDPQVLHNLSIMVLISLFFISAMLIWWISTNVQYTIENVLLYGVIFTTLTVIITWIFIIIIPCKTTVQKKPFINSDKMHILEDDDLSLMI
jgi:hypothetical protein